MAFFTVISLVMAVFGACHAIMAGIRSHSEKELDELVKECTTHCNSVLAGLVGCGVENTSKKDAEKDQETAKCAFKWWKITLALPTAGFAICITLLVVYAYFSPWIDGAGKVIEFPVEWVFWIRHGLLAYYILLALCVVALLKKRTLIKKMHTNLQRMATLTITLQNRPGDIRPTVASASPAA